MVIKLQDLLPDIHDFLEIDDNQYAVSTEGLEEIVLRLRTKIPLEKDILDQMTAWFFSEIRNSMLRGELVHIRDFGNFFISNSKIKKTYKNKKIIPTFKPHKKLLKRLNDQRK